MTWEKPAQIEPVLPSAETASVAKPDPQFVAWQREQQTRDPEAAFRKLERHLFANLAQEEIEEAQTAAEDVRAVMGTLDGPLHLPY
jgi:hypothetical protein